MQLGDRDTSLNQVPVDLSSALKVDDQAEAGVSQRGDIVGAGLRDQDLLRRRLGCAPNCKSRCAAQLVDRSLGDDLSFPDHADAGAHQLDLTEEVTGDQNGAVALAELDDQ